MCNSVQLGKTRFHKSQAFDFKEDLGVVYLEKRGIGGKLLQGQSPYKNNSVYPKGLGGDKPAWVAFDKQVCNASYTSHSRLVSHARLLTQGSPIHDPYCWSVGIRLTTTCGQSVVRAGA